jgi:hypothetical protein
MIRVFKTKAFQKWLKKVSLTDYELCNAVDEMRQGLYDADLGGGVFKKRIATGNKGKSAGVRTLLATNLGDRWFYIYGFAKSQRSNIDSSEALQLKKLAESLMALDEKMMQELLFAGRLMEICHEK